MEGRNHYKKGLWTVEEDKILVDYISMHGKGRWNRIAKMTGLKRCGKSCRLRWINYLSPNVKRGDFSEEEDELIIRLHKLLGNRWSLIAGRVPGRTDNQVKNHWNTHLSKKIGIKKETSKARRSTLTRECREVRETPNPPKDSNPMLASVNGDGGTASAEVNKGFQNVGNNCETQESAMSETGLSSFWIFNDNLNQGTLSFLDLLDGYPIDDVWNGL